MKPALLIATGLLLAPGLPRAGGMHVAPVVVELDGRTPSAVVTVRNGGGTATRYQVAALAWTEAGRETKLEPSKDLAVFPALFQLGAGQERRIRVGATVPPGAVERSWRLFIEELPAAEAGGGAARIRMRTRFAIPVFQAPVQERRSGSVSLERSGGTLKTIVKNTGTIHFRPDAITVALVGEKGERLHEAQVTPLNVLAASERAFDVSVPAEICARVWSARASVRLPDETLETALALAGGVCAP